MTVESPVTEGLATRRWLLLVLAGVATLTVLRLIALASTPLELYPEEAQYWLWSRRPALGYFSKPPMVAWLIALSTAIGGDAEAWVRAPATLLAAGTPVILYKAGERLAGPRVGAAAALIFALMPGMQLAAGVIATDAPLLFCLALALWAYAVLWTAEGARARRWAASGLGAAIGLGFLSKYAAAYMLVGLALHAAVSRRARAVWGPAEGAFALGAGLLILGPHLAWSVGHRFAAVAHVAANAGSRTARALDARGALGFLIGQFVVFGPIPFAVLLGGAAWRARRRGLDEGDVLLLCLTLPPLVIVLVEATLARANANWAAAAFVPAAALVAKWLVEQRAWRTLWVALVPQACLALLFVTAAAFPIVADRLGLGASLKYARGRAAQARVVAEALARARQGGAVTAVATDYRFDFNILAYYGRGLFDVSGRVGPGAEPLRMWARTERALSQADAEFRLTPREGGRVLFVNAVKSYGPEARADFAHVQDEARYAIPVGRKRVRSGALFVGLGFNPRPRGAASRASEDPS